MKNMKFLILFTAIILGGCGSDGKDGKDGAGGAKGDDGNSPPAYYTISGNASGIGSPGLTLQNSEADDLIVDSNGSFSFATSIIDGGVYDVTVLTNPDGQLCTVANGSGDVTANVSDITITCENAYRISGTVTGIGGRGIQLLNGTDATNKLRDGRFTFDSLVAVGDTYAVIIVDGDATKPSDCTISRGSGTVLDHVTDIAIDCIVQRDASADAYTLTPGIEVRFSTVGATLQTGEETCGMNTTSTTWFNFTAPKDGKFVTYAKGSDHDTIFGWTFTANSAPSGCGHQAADSNDAVGIPRLFATDEINYIQMGNYGAFGNRPATGTGSIGVTEVVAAADDLVDATTLDFAPGAPTAVIAIEFFGTETLSQAEDDAGMVCGPRLMASGSAWLEFVAPDTGTWMIESKSYEDTHLGVYRGTSFNNLLNCTVSDRRAVLVDLTAGETYTIRIAIEDVNDPGIVAVRAERVPATMTATRVDSSISGKYSSMAIINNKPAIAYLETDDGTLRYAELNDGIWSESVVAEHFSSPEIVVLTQSGTGNPAIITQNAIIYEPITPDPAGMYYLERVSDVWEISQITSNSFGYVSSLTMANGEPAVAYKNWATKSLEFAERIGGRWTKTEVHSTNADLGIRPGEYTSMAQFDNGDIGISYVSYNQEKDRFDLYFARRSGVVWTTELVYKMREGDFQLLADTSLVIDSAGNAIISALDVEEGRHLLFLQNGADWDIEQDYADRHLAQMDHYNTISKLLLGEDGTLYLVWVDSNYAATVAMSVRDPAGNWTVQDLVPYFVDPNDNDYQGNNVVWSTAQLGAVLLPNGRLGVSVQLTDDKTLWYIEGEL